MSNTNRFFIITNLITIIGLIIASNIAIFVLPYFQDNYNAVILTNKINFINVIFFYFGLFLFCFGFFATIIFWFKKKKISENNLYFCSQTSFRQGFFASILVVLLLSMQHKQILVWWDVLLLIFFIIIIEIYIKSKTIDRY